MTRGCIHFCRTTPLLSDLLILAYQEKLPVLALRGSNKKVLETIKVSRVACLGIKNVSFSSLLDEHRLTSPPSR